MTDAIEIRHYITRSGKDAVNDWLSELADIRAQAKIAARINRLAVGNFGDCKTLGRGYMNYGSIGEPDSASITRSSAKPASCFSVEETNVRSQPISRRHTNT